MNTISVLLCKLNLTKLTERFRITSGLSVCNCHFVLGERKHGRMGN